MFSLTKTKNLSAMLDRAPVEVSASGDTATTPYLVKPQAHGSLGDLPYVNAAEEPSAVVFSRRGSDGNWRGVTAAEFAAEVTAVAKGLIASGIEPGDRIALMSRTCDVGGGRGAGTPLPDRVGAAGGRDPPRCQGDDGVRRRRGVRGRARCRLP
jgi:hypothetical protein